MSIESSSIAIGTTLGVTGGTATTMIPKGTTLTQSSCILNDGAAFKDQITLDFQTKDPKVSSNAPAGYTQGRASVVIAIPKTLANSNVTKNTIRIEMSCDSETTDAERSELREIAAQVIFDTDFDQFWNDLSVV